MPDGQQRVPTAVEPLPTELEPLLADVEAGEQRTQALSTRQIAWRRFKRHRLAMISLVVLAILGLTALFAPLITTQSFHKIDIIGQLQSPSAKHWFGTNNVGQDEFARVMFGGRISLMIGLLVAIFSGIIGLLVGALAGFYGRWVDQLLMRFTDLFLAIPFLVVAILGTTLIQRAFPHMSTIRAIIIILTIFFWMPTARIVRGVVLSLKEKEFVEAARASGASNRRIIFGHIIPNCMGPIIVVVTLSVAAAILTESALSFVGYGIQTPDVSWGKLLNDARNFMFIHPALIWFPGLFILITVLAVNFVGDGLRDAFDPHQQLKTQI